MIVIVSKLKTVLRVQLEALGYWVNVILIREVFFSCLNVVSVADSHRPPTNGVARLLAGALLGAEYLNLHSRAAAKLLHFNTDPKLSNVIT